jgi:type IV pilus assembly protein PilE
MPAAQFPRQLATGAGFTLTQLLVTIAIVAILATIGYPSYRAQIEQTRRAEMQAELLSLAQFMERRHAENGCYNEGADCDCTTPGDAGLPCTLDLPSLFPRGADNDPKYYRVELIDGSLGADTFEFVAIPINSQAGDGRLFIDQAQRRSWDENGDGDGDDAGEDDWNRG